MLVGREGDGQHGAGPAGRRPGAGLAAVADQAGAGRLRALEALVDEAGPGVEGGQLGAGPHAAVVGQQGGVLVGRRAAGVVVVGPVEPGGRRDDDRVEVAADVDEPEGGVVLDRPDRTLGLPGVEVGVDLAPRQVEDREVGAGHAVDVVEVAGDEELGAVR